MKNSLNQNSLFCLSAFCWFTFTLRREEEEEGSRAFTGFRFRYSFTLMEGNLAGCRSHPLIRSRYPKPTCMSLPEAGKHPSNYESFGHVSFKTLWDECILSPPLEPDPKLRIVRVFTNNFLIKISGSKRGSRAGSYDIPPSTNHSRHSSWVPSSPYPYASK